MWVWVRVCRGAGVLGCKHARLNIIIIDLPCDCLHVMVTKLIWFSSGHIVLLSCLKSNSNLIVIYM